MTSNSLLNTSMMNKYAHFLEQSNGIHPRPEVASERHLAVWATEMGFLCENGELPAADRARLRAFPNWADTRLDRQFLNRVREYELWLEEHDGAAPRMNGVGICYYERSLGVWAAVTRHAIRNEGVHYRKREERAEILRARLPGLLDNGFQKWGLLFREYVAFQQRIGSNPEFVRGANANENRLARWMIRQREELSCDRLTGDRKSALDAAIPGWSDGVDMTWEATFARYEAFVSRNSGCAPRDATGNKLEQFLYSWDIEMRRSIGAHLLPIDRLRLFQGVGARTEHNAAACQHVNQPRRRG